MKPLWKKKRKRNNLMDSLDLFSKLNDIAKELPQVETMDPAEKINFLQTKLRELMDVEFIIEDEIMFLKREFRK